MRRKTKSFFIGFGLLSLGACSQSTPTDASIGRGTHVSLCDAFVASARDTLKLHLVFSVDELRPKLHETLNALAKRWEVQGQTFPLKDPVCNEFQDVYDSAFAKSPDNVKSELYFYRLALSEFVKKLDVHSTYYGPNASEDFNLRRKNKSKGVGIIFQIRLPYLWKKVPNLVVEEVVKGSPADGEVEAGDEIVSINGESVGSFQMREIHKAIRESESVELVLKRLPNKTIKLSHAQYDYPPVFSKIYTTPEQRKIGYVKIRNFVQNSANQTMKHFKKVLDEGAEGIFLDLRLNPGGNTSEVMKIADFLTDNNKVLLSYEIHPKKNNVPRLASFVSRPYVGRSGALTEVPIILTTDALSASASEILTGIAAIDRVLHVASTTTYGKGTVQEPIRIHPSNPLGGLVTLTIGRYQVSDGSSPQLYGYRPHILVRDILLEDLIKNNFGGEPTILFERDHSEGTVPGGKRRQNNLPRGSRLRTFYQRVNSIAPYVEQDCDSALRDCILEKSLYFFDEAIEMELAWNTPET